AADLREGQLALVQRDLGAQVLHRAVVVPLDARVEHRDRHVGPAGGGLPGGRVAGRRGGVHHVRAANAVELVRVAGEARAVRSGRGGELPIVAVAAQVVRRLA